MQVEIDLVAWLFFNRIIQSVIGLEQSAQVFKVSRLCDCGGIYEWAGRHSGGRVVRQRFVTRLTEVVMNTSFMRFPFIPSAFRHAGESARQNLSVEP